MSQDQIFKTDKLEMLAARDNTVIDNPYQSSLIRSNWNRTTNNAQGQRMHVVSQENTVV